MTTSAYTTTIRVNQSPKEVFNAINNVRGWWSKSGISGSTDKLYDEFIFQAADVHASTQKIIEFVPNQKVVWLVTDSKLSFIEKKDEWTGTTISFDINRKDGQTELRFSHEGLVPEIECYDACSNAWNQVIHESLLSLITTGTAQPIF